MLPSMQNTTPDELLTVRAVASELGWTRRYIYDLIKAGRIEPTRLGPQSIRVKRSALNAFIERAAS